MTRVTKAIYEITLGGESTGGDLVVTRSPLVASLLVASLPGGEVTVNPVDKHFFLEGKTPRDVGIQFRDDTFVNLRYDDDLIDAFRCLRPVDNSEDLYRLSFRVHATATPVQAVPFRTERTIANEPAQRRCVSPAP